MKYPDYAECMNQMVPRSFLVAGCLEARSDPAARLRVAQSDPCELNPVLSLCSLSTSPFHLQLSTMLFSIPILVLLPYLGVSLAAEEVTTEYTVTNECTRKTQRGDTIQVHYKGTLASDGSKFDASYDRGQPLDFTVGKGMVIKG